ncbi:MAG: hypothetical protein WAK55_08725 [Xanthobacteraceae bacterium]
MRLADPVRNGWGQVFQLGPYVLWHLPGFDTYGWHRFVVRYRDPDANRRSYWIDWNAAESRLAYSVHANNLATDHPRFLAELQRRLRAWRP